MRQETLSLSTTAAENYRARFRRVLEHIDAYLDSDLPVDDLADVAAFSKFHFQRQFSALFGLGVYKYIQLRRLKRASYQLAFRGDTPVTDIAMASGYEGLESFSRAFKKSLGQTPSEFREQPQWGAWHTTYQPLRELRTQYMKVNHRADQVVIVECKQTKVAALEHRGSADELEHSTRRFIEWRRQNRLPPKISATFNVVYKHSPVDSRYDLCAATEREVAPNDIGVVNKTIPGGRCAVLRHIGSEDTLGAAIDFLYATWLPDSGEELRDFPLYFQRVSLFPDVPEHEAVTDIFLPLK